MQKILQIFTANGYSSGGEAIGGLEKYSHLINQLEPFFRENAQNKINLTNKYVNQVIDGTKNIAIFDIGYRGTVTKFLFDEFNICTDCYNLLGYSKQSHFLKNTQGCKISSFIEFGQKTINQAKPVLHKFLEELISEPVGSVESLVEAPNGDIKLQYENRFAQPNNVFENIRMEIVDFANLFFDLFTGIIHNLEFDKYAFWDIVLEVLENPKEIDTTLLIRNVAFEASFISLASKPIYEQWYSKHFKTTASANESQGLIQNEL